MVDNDGHNSNSMAKDEIYSKTGTDPEINQGGWLAYISGCIFHICSYCEHL